MWRWMFISFYALTKALPRRTRSAARGSTDDVSVRLHEHGGGDGDSEEGGFRREQRLRVVNARLLGISRYSYPLQYAN